MAIDTKKIIIKTFLEISSENKIATIQEISKRSYITRKTISRNFNNGISDIMQYIYSEIISTVNAELLKHNLNNLSLEEFADIILPIVWSYRQEIKILYSSPFYSRVVPIATNSIWSWLELRFQNLVKLHNLSPAFHGIELLNYWNLYLFSILTLWVTSPNPSSVSIFRTRFIFLMKTSIRELIFKEVK